MKIYLLIGLLTLVCELLYFRLAERYRIIDKPNLRSSHRHVTLRGGGIIFVIGVLLYTLFFGCPYPCFLAGLILISAISFADDIRSVPSRIRILVHFAAMLLMFRQWEILNIAQWPYVVIALIVCTGIINAFNFMDGINGITGGYALAVLIPLILLNTRTVFIDEPLLIVTGISLLVFCFFNFRKQARCFAGDVGSVSIAFILLFMLGRLIIQSGDLWYLIFFAVYGTDAVLTICHRLLLHENIFQPHRKHLYQLMANELQIPHIIVSLTYFLLQLLISFGAIYCPINKWIYFAGVCLLLCAVYCLFMRKYYPLHEAYLKSAKS